MRAAAIANPDGSIVVSERSGSYLGNCRGGSQVTAPEISKRLGEIKGQFKKLARGVAAFHFIFHFLCVVSKLLYCLDTFWVNFKLSSRKSMGFKLSALDPLHATTLHPSTLQHQAIAAVHKEGIGFRSVQIWQRKSMRTPEIAEGLMPQCGAPKCNLFVSRQVQHLREFAVGPLHWSGTLAYMLQLHPF